MAILAGFFVLESVLLGLLCLIFWRGRVAHVACPGCAHNIQGLPEPRCPECGRDLTEGVVLPGGLRPKQRLWLGVVVLVLGVVTSFLALGLLGTSWDLILRRAGLVYMQQDFNRKVETEIDAFNRLEVRSTGTYAQNNLTNEVGEVTVILSLNDRDIATWKGMGPIEVRPSEGVRIDGNEVIEGLRSQVSEESESRFASLLHNEEDAVLLGDVIVSYAAPQGSVSAGALDSRGSKMFDGSISASNAGGGQLVWPSAIWFAPIYVIPAVLFLGFLILGLRILIFRRHLQPFEVNAERAFT